MAFLLVGLGAGAYSAVHFRINSDVNDLLSNDLAWRKREKAFEQSFDRMKMLYAVVEAPTPELTSQATAALAAPAGAGQGPFLGRRRYRRVAVLRAERPAVPDARSPAREPCRTGAGRAAHSGPRLGHEPRRARRGARGRTDRRQRQQGDAGPDGSAAQFRRDDNRSRQCGPSRQLFVARGDRGPSRLAGRIARRDPVAPGARLQLGAARPRRQHNFARDRG